MMNLSKTIQLTLALASLVSLACGYRLYTDWESFEKTLSSRDLSDASECSAQRLTNQVLKLINDYSIDHHSNEWLAYLVTREEGKSIRLLIEKCEKEYKEVIRKAFFSYEGFQYSLINYWSEALTKFKYELGKESLKQNDLVDGVASGVTNLGVISHDEQAAIGNIHKLFANQCSTVLLNVCFYPTTEVYLLMNLLFRPDSPLRLVKNVQELKSKPPDSSRIAWKFYNFIEACEKFALFPQFASNRVKDRKFDLIIRERQPSIDENTFFEQVVKKSLELSHAT